MAKGACENPEMNNQVTDYCFGDLDGRLRDEYEAHVIGCDLCWMEIRKLDMAIAVLRNDKVLWRKMQPTLRKLGITFATLEEMRRKKRKSRRKTPTKR